MSLLWVYQDLGPNNWNNPAFWKARSRRSKSSKRSAAQYYATAIGAIIDRRKGVVGDRLLVESRS